LSRAGTYLATNLGNVSCGFGGPAVPTAKMEIEADNSQVGLKIKSAL